MLLMICAEGVVQRHCRNVYLQLKAMDTTLLIKFDSLNPPTAFQRHMQHCRIAGDTVARV